MLKIVNKTLNIKNDKSFNVTMKEILQDIYNKGVKNGQDLLDDGRDKEVIESHLAKISEMKSMTTEEEIQLDSLLYNFYYESFRLGYVFSF